ncbi:hypothetical protein AAC387_Pa05g3763 [Persea americana]
MSPDSSRSPPRGRRIRTSERALYRDAPYRRDRRSYKQNYLCNNCKRPGHYARDCPNALVCNNCALPGHIAAECTGKTTCWNCREPGHLASECSNEPVCHTCGKMGHLARDCSGLGAAPFDPRLCNNCHKPGHIAADCTNDKAYGVTTCIGFVIFIPMQLHRSTRIYPCTVWSALAQIQIRNMHTFVY